jgi:hypothetical protein
LTPAQESLDEVRYLRCLLDDARKTLNSQNCHPQVLRVVAGAREFEAATKYEENKRPAPPPSVSYRFQPFATVNTQPKAVPSPIQIL